MLLLCGSMVNSYQEHNIYAGHIIFVTTTLITVLHSSYVSLNCMHFVYTIYANPDQSTYYPFRFR